MWHLAINNLVGRLGRSALLVVAMALATALAVAAAAALGTLSHSIDMAMASLIGRSDVQIVHQFTGRLPGTLLEEARQWPGVEAASAWVNVGVTVTRGGADADTRTFVAANARGIDPAVDARIHPPRLSIGRMLQDDGEAVLDQTVAATLGVEPGDAVTLTSFGHDPVTLIVTGFIEHPPLGLLQKPVLLVTQGLASSLSEVPGMVDVVYLRLSDSSDEAREAFVAAMETKLPAMTRFHTPASAGARVNQGIEATRFLLSVIITVVYLSAGFIILTSLTTAVTQRTMELAVMRCIGAARSQIAGAQLLTGALLAGVGALLGTPLGLAIAAGIYLAYRDMLPGGFDANWPRVAAAVSVAVLSGVLGAAYPAWLAASVSPLHALKARARKPRAIHAVACVAAGLAMALCVPSLMAVSRDHEAVFYFYAYVGIPLQLLGYFLLCVPLMLLAAGVLSPMLSRVLRLPPNLLRRTVLATPFRHAFTGGTLMVSIALLVSVWSGGRGVMEGWFADLDMPDAFIAAPLGMGFTDEQLQRLEAIDAVTGISPTVVLPVRMENTRLGLTRFAPRQTWFFGFDPDHFFAMTQVDWTQGNEADASARLKRGDALLISREYHVAHGLNIGDTVTLQTLEGPRPFEIAGVVSSKGLDIAVHFFGLHGVYGEAAVSTVFGLRDDAQRYFQTDRARIVLLTLHEDTDDDEALAAIRSLFPGAAADSSRAIRRLSQASAQRVLHVASVIALAALVIACFGVGNLIIAEVSSRQYEYGVLRAIGAERGLIGRLVAGQVLLMAVVGCVAGSTLGMQFAATDQAFYRRLSGLVYPVRVPWDVLALGCGAVVLAAMLAALPTLWRLMRRSPRVLLATRRVG